MSWAPGIRLHLLSSSTDTNIFKDADHDCKALWVTPQGDFDSNVLRLVYESLTTPSTTLDENMATGNRHAFL